MTKSNKIFVVLQSIILSALMVISAAPTYAAGGCDPWYLPSGITENDVIAAYKFVGQDSMTEALKNVNELTSYPLTPLGADASLVTYNKNTGIFIPATSKNGNGGTGLANTALNAKASEAKSIFVRYSNYTDTNRVALLASLGSTDQMLFAGAGNWDFCINGAYNDAFFSRNTLGVPGFRTTAGVTSLSSKNGEYAYSNLYYANAAKSSGVLGRVTTGSTPYANLYIEGVSSSVSSKKIQTAQRNTYTISREASFGSTAVSFGNGIYGTYGCNQSATGIDGQRWDDDQEKWVDNKVKVCRSNPSLFASYNIQAIVVYNKALTPAQAAEITQNMYVFDDRTCNIDINVNVVWQDNSNKYSTRPSSIQVGLYADNTLSQTLTLSGSGNTWTTTATDLPVKKTGASTEIAYSVKQITSLSGYSNSVSGDKTAGFTVTDTMLTKKIDVSKIWDGDNDNIFGSRPDSVIFDAYIGSGTTSAGNCTANAAGSWKCSISGLPTHDSSNNQILYTVKERSTPYGYSSTTVETTGTTADITNTLDTKSIAITKEWVDDNNNIFGTRPTSLIFDVYVGSGATSVGNCTANSSSSWKCSVSGLAKVDKDNNAVSYTIKERTVPSAYSSSDVTTTGTAATIQNTLETKDITVTKTWDDQSDFWKLRPEKTEIGAYLNNTLVESCEAAASSSWECDLTVASKTSSGAEQTYVIKEVEIPAGYESDSVTVTTSGQNTLTIANKLIVKDLNVVKNWDDGDDRDRKRPTSITLELYRNGNLEKTETISAANNTLAANQWQCIFENVPVYNKAGTLENYEIKEQK